MSYAGRIAVSALAYGATAFPALSEPKNDYSIFNPTPQHLLRDMTTDRPDATESPFTIDAGHVQFETTLAGYARGRKDPFGVRETSFSSSINMRIGLTNAAEFGLVWQPYGSVDVQNLGHTSNEHFSGSGGLDLRAKFNLWGNDKFAQPGDTALALLPFVTLAPNAKNGIGPAHTEGGLIVPFAIELPENFGLGVNAGFVRANDGDGAGYFTKAIGTVVISYEWTPTFGTFYELAAELRDGPDIVTANTGLTYSVTPNLQLDAGINLGLTGASDRVSTFVGLSQRF